MDSSPLLRRPSRRLLDLAPALAFMGVAALSGPSTWAADDARLSHHGERCGQTDAPALQILGSGGPLNGGGRASTSYLIWLASRPALLVDVGSGAMVNFARASADVRELDAVVITHLHPDHVSDLPALLWDAEVAGRNHPLKIFGPGSAPGLFPPVDDFVVRLFGSGGAFPFMRDLLDRKSPFHVEVKTLDTSHAQTIPVYEADALRVTAYPVPHGKAPTVAVRVDTRGFTVVFAEDQNGMDPQFAVFARDADILVLHVALGPNGEDHPFAKVIGTPRALARLASEAHAKRVILSHLMAFPSADPTAKAFSLANPAALLQTFYAAYPGKVSIAEDLECLELQAKPK